jgi:CheY-like chemotaxis protein
MNGIEVAELLQKQYKIPILYLSGDTEDETLIDADRIECKVFLSKPIYKSTLNMAMTLTRFKNCMYLQTQSLQLEELIFSLTEPALLLKEQQVINMNDNAKELLGANDLKDCNKSILEYIRPDSQPSFLEIYKKLFQHSLLLQYVKLSFLDCNNNSFKRGCSIGFIQDYDGNYTILIFDKLLL